jgi:hypothetical protein
VSWNLGLNCDFFNFNNLEDIILRLLLLHGATCDSESRNRQGGHRKTQVALHKYSP